MTAAYIPVLTFPISASERNRLEEMASILKAIGHPKRLAIIELVAEKGRVSVNEIVETLHCEQSCISHHLTGLRLKKILTCERDGQFIFYSLTQSDIMKLVDCARKFVDIGHFPI